MERFKKIFSWVLKALGSIVLIFFLFIAGIHFFSRQEKALAKEFLLLAGDKNYEAAFELTSNDLRKIYPLQMLKSQFETLQAYTEVSFNTVHIGSGKTTLFGTATTAGNCISSIAFVVIDNHISTFQIDNPCLDDQVAA
ncbi:hypothetical protein [Ruegeria lacuscaerulensis]|uniref:hypothetical protein n=1 Tax=Ruegeria lacuscaerulensis TaxID=55218 RepID=UPI00147A89E2|nr:hypothetical protein [Ruegeria lacuscaerulensis]